MIDAAENCGQGASASEMTIAESSHRFVVRVNWDCFQGAF